jgi:hypothetical protein
MRWLFLLLPLIVAGCDRADAQPNVSKGTSTDTGAPQEIVRPKWDTLSGFDYTPRMTFPEGVRALHGKTIEIRGYLYPTRQTRDLREFILMRDPGTCCYGPNAQYNHFLLVKVVKGPGANYTRDPVTVTGTFILEEKIDGDYIDGIYSLEATEHRR